MLVQLMAPQKRVKGM